MNDRRRRPRGKRIALAAGLSVAVLSGLAWIVTRPTVPVDVNSDRPSRPPVEPFPQMTFDAERHVFTAHPWDLLGKWRAPDNGDVYEFRSGGLALGYMEPDGPICWGIGPIEDRWYPRDYAWVAVDDWLVLANERRQIAFAYEYEIDGKVLTLKPAMLARQGSTGFAHGRTYERIDE